LAKPILDGIVVCDFSWVGAGPITTQNLAMMGATVIHIETHKRPEILRVTPPFKDRKPGVERSGYFSPRNANKLGLSLDLAKPEAIAVVKRLLTMSDIVINNFSFGVMDKWGLSYEDCKKIKPDIIYIEMPPQGRTGPHKDFMAFGSLINALVGATFLTGHPDQKPAGTGTNYTDHVPVPGHLTFAIMAALRHRRKTGEGQFIELAQSQAGVNMVSAIPVMDYAVNGRIQQRMGNRHLELAPHNLYNCKGERNWIAIAVYNDQEWESLKKVMGSPEWADDPKFATNEGRKANEDELDAKIEEWTSAKWHRQLMDELVREGVRAGVVHSCRDVTEDYNLVERGFWTYLMHPEAGLALYNHSPMRMSKVPVLSTTPANMIGQHNQQVLHDLLKYTDEEIKEMEEKGVLN